jgi:hypothetical protein
MSTRRGRAAERGSQTLELVAALPLLGMLLLLGWQCIVLARQQVEAQADARELARQAVLCARAAPPPRLGDVDQGVAGTATVGSPPGHPLLVRVEVRLAPASVLPDVSFPADWPLAPHAVVVMRHEPC